MKTPVRTELERALDEQRKAMAASAQERAEAVLHPQAWWISRC